MAHALDGVTDDAKRTAIKALLMNSRQRYGASALDAGLEMDGILSNAFSLPANRMLNLFRELKADRVNKWWVGLGTRLEGRRIQEKLSWQQVPGLDPPTIRSRTMPISATHIGVPFRYFH